MQHLPFSGHATSAPVAIRLLRPFRLACSFLFLTGSLHGLAQSQVKGKVTNISGEALPMVPLVIIDSLLGGITTYALTDEQGRYVLNGLKAGSYVMNVKALGYEDHHSDRFTIDGRPATILTRDIVLVPKSIELKEVVISAQLPLFRQEIDRLIFNVGNSPASQGGDAIDALKNTPLLRVDERTNAISMIGKSNLRVMVNGRMLNLSGEELITYLRTLPADNIASIEVITTPPARYEAEGNSGLLNIVLKKMPGNGFKGALSSSYTQRTYPSTNNSVNLVYRTPKFSSTVMSGFNRTRIKAFEGYDNLFTDGVVNVGEQHKQTRSDDLSSSVDLGYTVSPKVDLGLIYRINAWDFTSDDRSNRDLLVQDSLVTRLVNEGAGGLTGVFQHADLFALCKLDTSGRTMELGVQYMTNRMDQDRRNDSNEDGNPGTVVNRSENGYGIWIGSLDLELPFKKVSVQAGGRFSLFDNQSQLRFDSIVGGQVVPAPLLSNDFDFTEAIAAAYVSGEAKLSSTWSVQAGLRYEHTANEGRDEGGAVVTERRYGSWFPSFYLGYAPSDQRAWTFRYSRRVNRPAMNDLNPFRWYINPANYVEGNPLLQPAFINNLELSFSNNNNLSAAVYHSLTSSASTYASIFTDGGATSYVMTLNALDQQQYGIQANYAFTAVKNLQTEASASLFRCEARTLVPEQVPSVEGNGATFALNNTLTVDTVHTLFLNLDQSFMTVQGNMETRPYCFASAGYRVSLLREKLRIAVVYSMLLSKDRRIAYTQFLPNGVANGVNEYDYTSLRFSLNYRFGSDKLRSARQKAYQEEQDRIR